ncbi:MAG: VOC family protein [Solirubrobacteraceae bacterium]
MEHVTIDEITLADEPAAWAALGFELDGELCRLGDVAVRLTGAGSGRGIVGWSLRGVQSTELDGLPTTLSEHARGTAPAVEHPNGVSGIDHVVAMSPSFERSVAALRAAGLDLRRIREEPTPAGAPRQAFFRLGREILELVEQPEEIVARSGGADGPARFWGMALLAEDLDATVAALGQGVSEIRPAVQPGRRIATVRRSAGLAVPLALISPKEQMEVAR